MDDTMDNTMDNTEIKIQIRFKKYDNRPVIREYMAYHSITNSKKRCQNIHDQI